MTTKEQLLSPKQVARGLGVSESSLKRWCDQGRINTVRTAGGHRKIALADALRYAREQKLELASPELLQLPISAQHAPETLEAASSRMVEFLLQGDEPIVRQIVIDLYAANYTCSAICDNVIATAFREIGERWACNTADVYQERRACEIVQRILFELRRLQSPRKRVAAAAGGTVEGDHYSLATAMAELVLSEAGFSAASLGTSIPWTSLVKAVTEMNLELFWLSVSHISDMASFLKGFAELSETCTKAGTALVVGGRALTEEVRTRLTYSAFCDNMQHLESFAKTLRRAASSKRKARTSRTSSRRAGRN